MSRGDWSSDVCSSDLMEIEMNSKLSKQKSDAAAFLAQMQTNYDNHHRTYVQKLFEQLVKE